MSQFVHLHVHTQYSILDGASNIKKMIKKAKSLGMDSIAITDHGNMFGVKDFHQTALKEGIKPILGCECYCARNGRFEKSRPEDRSGYHLILLAKNSVGYHNLVKMVSHSYTEGLHYRPRIDKDLIEKYHEGLICSSACLGGEIQQHILSGNLDKAEESILWFKNIFKDDYYLELQLHKTKIAGVSNKIYHEQQIVNTELLKFGKKHGIKCIATNDIHFIEAEDAVAHDHLICLNTKKRLTDEDRMRYSGQEYLKSYEEMLEMFPDNPEILSNTLEIEAKIEDINLDHKPIMPNFPLPDDFVILIERLKKSYRISLDSVVVQVKDNDKQEALKQEVDKIFEKLNSFESVAEFENEVYNNSSDWSECLDAISKLDITKQYLYLEYITFKGAEIRYPNMDEATRERIEFELATIEKMGFPGYFLIVWDFIKAGREMGVAVGPGRGSAAGSVVAYSLWITNIDPIRYNLLFERFLNPERISMPDIDIDFDDDGREKIMEYVVKKYGAGKVAHIITFGKMGAKNAIKDVARVQELSISESDRLSKMVPEKPGTTLQSAFEAVPELSDERNSDNPLIKNTLDFAVTLEGSIRQTGVHACGIIIGKEDLENYIPVCIDRNIALNIVQYDGHYVESIGLLKMDFLGLRTLSIIKDCIRNIKQSRGIDINIEEISKEDKKTFELYARGDTTGIFQFESPGMKKHLRALQPNRFEDLIAMNALYRPGPMDYIPDFIARKKGEKKIEYDMPNMDTYLEETYGITVYQEQVMLLAQLLAGFTKGQADRLRKAMGKKIKSELDKLKDVFIDGAVNNGYDKDKCNEVWGKWEAFASYAFNKSHSTCYAWVSYQTAYLKAHYPAEFMSALLSRNFSDIKKISFFMDECGKMGCLVKGPDVNESYLEFSVDSENNIRFGLSAIKGIGTAASESLINERITNGRYKDIFDFIERVDHRVIGKKTVENLIDSGAFDGLSGVNRTIFKYQANENESTFLDRLFDYGTKFKNEKLASVNSLFGDFETTSDMIARPQMPNESLVSWSNIAILNREKELIGMFVSSNPLDDFKYLIDKYALSSISMLENPESNKEKNFSVAGIVDSVIIAQAKNGNNFCKLTIVGYEGSYEFSMFGSNFDKFHNYYHKDLILNISGRIGKRFDKDTYRPIVNSIKTMQEVNESVKGIELTIDNDMIDDKFNKDLMSICNEHSGNKNLYIRVYDANEKVILSLASNSIKVEPNSLLVKSIEKMNIKYRLI